MMALKTLLASAALAGVMALTASVAQAREMSLATYIPANSSFVTELVEPLVAWINERANGEFTITVYAGGTLGRDPNQQDRIVSSGIADMAAIVPSRNPGAYPHYRIFELPGMARSAEEGSYAAWQLHQEGILQTGDTLHVIAVWTTDPYLIHTAEPVNGPGDVAGLRMRVLGQTQTESVLALGGVPQGMSMTEAPEAISRGTLDGALADWAVYDIFRLGEVADYTYTMPLGVLAMALVMNPDSYAELSPAGQALLDQAGEEWQRLLAEFYGRDRARIIEEGVARGHVITQASDADIAAVNEVTSGMRESMRSVVGEEVLDAYGRLLDAYRAGAR
ncbi:TRAP-type C4-dicarboxylate transport system substrate-binding protein [Aquamicrobium lusatiense]|uniref:TRAP-type C4-dicarboxylate transport system substrate-binding protein n=1 Tax=Aquamicrobium lusatiense TaxID=89772 RepID=A0A7W9VXC6_9HYPH|nr:TRAP transporter substrate-binding protein [Aquamicrobium lusatiense]MBB6014581.1 TRAP-type C4-dicarboxylate transport system substrate-binding protein [Aquamicrobium lusatiense]